MPGISKMRQPQNSLPMKTVEVAQRILLQSATKTIRK